MSPVAVLLRSFGLLLNLITKTTGEFCCIRLLTLTFLPAFADAFLTRSNYWHPDVNLPRLNCTGDYRKAYCHNGGVCFMQLDINNDPKPYCICADGYRGRRCERIHDDNVWQVIQDRQEKWNETVTLSALGTLLVAGTCIAALALYVYLRRAKYPTEYVDATSENGSIDSPFSFRGRNDAHAFRTRRKESTPIGTTESSRNRPPSVQQTTTDFWPQEGESGGSRSYQSSQFVYVHRSVSALSVAEPEASSV